MRILKKLSLEWLDIIGDYIAYWWEAKVMYLMDGEISFVSNYIEYGEF